jgi:hypothetical protein
VATGLLLEMMGEYMNLMGVGGTEYGVQTDGRSEVGGGLRSCGIGIESRLTHRPTIGGT